MKVFEEIQTRESFDLRIRMEIMDGNEQILNFGFSHFKAIAIGQLVESQVHRPYILSCNQR
jgi:hypothetical protein